MGMRKTLNVWKGKRISQQRCYIRERREGKKKKKDKRRMLSKSLDKEEVEIITVGFQGWRTENEAAI